MSLTVNSRPATWAGTSGPIIYKMTTTDHANAGYYLLVEIWNSTTGLKIGSQKCYPNSGGLLSVRVESILRSNMSLDNNSDLTTGDTVYLDGNWIKYYIKYNQYWTGSSPALIDDVANLRYAIYGGLQIGSTNDFASYLISLFPILSNKATSIAGRNWLCNVISNTNGKSIRLRKYISGVITQTNYFSLNDNSVSRVKVNEIIYDMVDLRVVERYLLRNPNTPWVNVGAFPMTFNDGFLSIIRNTIGARSYAATDLFVIGSGVTVVITCNIDVTPGFASAPSPPIVSFDMLDGSDVVSGSSSAKNITSSGEYTFILTTTAVIAKIRINVSELGSPSSDQLDIYPLSVIDDTGVSEIRQIEILPDISNIIMLQWKNSLGGDECFPFTYNQEYFYTNSDGKKSKRMILYANGLTPLQWDAIQGCKSVGDVYRTPINELTTSLNRTVGRIGQSVYVLNSDGTKTGVIVIPNSDSSFTKKTIHSNRYQ